MSRSFASRKPVAFLTLAALCLVLIIGTRAPAGNLLNQRSVGGVAVDANGVVRQVSISERDEFLQQLHQATEKAAPELNLPVELRKVSLRGLESALREALQNRPGALPDEIQLLAGLQRIQFILVYPEQKDIVLAGPGEGWKIDDQANIVGATTGQPVLHLEDLLVAFRTAEAARREGISVSIDPTEEGRRNFDQFMSTQRVFNPSVLQGIERAMGPQQVSFTGVPVNTHFARVLVAADYRMKRLAMNFDEAPVAELPSFLDLLSAKRRTPGNAMPRWWLACNYEPLARSQDELVWELRGQGVKAMTEDELIQDDGTVRGTGRQDPIAKEWADRMTAKYEALAKSEPVFAELRNLMDMCVVAALIQHEDLCAMAGGAEFPLLMGGENGMTLDSWNPPKTVPTRCSFLKIGRNFVITASGGVQIESWEVASKSEVDAAVGQVHGKAAKPESSAWWWN